MARSENARKSLFYTRELSVVTNIVEFILGERLEAIKELFQRIIDETTTFVNHLIAM
jgi:hypothetical protein